MSRLQFVPKEADKAYVSNSLWLPKRLLRAETLKRALDFQVQGREGLVRLSMWDESSNHIICPREFIPPSDYPKYKFPFIDLRPQFQKVEFEDLVTPRSEEQQKAWQALAVNDNGILNLGCGKGKTKLSLKKIAQKGVPTLVVVPDGGMLDQWRKSIFGDDRTPPGLKFDGELGIIQGPAFSWAKPLTLALVTTLALRIRDGAIPEEFFRYFGLVVYDEVHQIGAPMFSLTAAPFFGDRIGLTATVQREDGLDPIYRYHIGEPFYTDLTQDLIPRIYFQKTPVNFDLRDTIVGSQTNISLLRTKLGRDLVGNTFRYWAIREALDQGRKILCLSHSKDQLKLMHSLFPESGLIISETSREKRLEVLRNSRLCFAVAKLGSTGVDDDRLDTLFWLTPFRSLIALQQSMGRIQRAYAGKADPVMTVFDDFLLPPVKNLCKNLKSTLKKWGMHFETIAPRNLPSALPAEVQASYDRELQALPVRGENEDDE
jgi:superfamily II DNA or RNA helicase